MTPDEAHRILFFDTMNERGAYVLLRLGADPGPDSIYRLKSALRVLWRAYRDEEGLPYGISSLAAAILQFQDEAQRNIRDLPTELRERLSMEISGIALHAYQLLCGPRAELGGKGEE